MSPLLSTVLWIIFQVCLPTSILILLVSAFVLNLDWHIYAIMWHIVNVMVWLIEFAINALPLMYNAGGSMMTLWIVLYTLFSWGYYGIGGGRFTYDYLDYSKSWNALMYGVNTAAHLLIWSVVWCAHSKTQRQQQIDQLAAGTEASALLVSSRSGGGSSSSSNNKALQNYNSTMTITEV